MERYLVMNYMLLVVLVAWLSSGVGGQSICTQADVDAAATKCFSCSKKGLCETADQAPTEKDACPLNEACRVMAGVAVCRPVAETDCACGGGLRGCDPYNPLQPLFCFPGGFADGVLCTAPAKCYGGECSATPPPGTELTPEQICAADATALGWQSVTPNCTAGVLCVSGASRAVVPCGAGQYFDAVAVGCKDLPLDHCADCTGLCPHLINCTMAVLCGPDGDVLDHEPCPDGQVYSGATKGCAAPATPPAVEACDAFKECTMLESVTAAPGTASTPLGGVTLPGGGTVPPAGNSTRPSECTEGNVGEVYVYEADCKRYYSCRLVGRGEYGYVIGTCYASYVFNPTTLQCAPASEVPSCAA